MDENTYRVARLAADCQKRDQALERLRTQLDWGGVQAINDLRKAGV